MFAFKFSTFFLICGLAFGQLDSSVSITNHRQISISQENAWIDKDGNSLLNTLGVAGTPVTNSVLDVTGSLSLKEQATADGDTVDWGQIWVKNTSPTELWYTDDLGSNFNIGASGGVGGSGTTDFIPKWATSSTLNDTIVSQTGDVILIENSADGSDVSLTVSNTSNTASSTATLEIKVAGESASDVGLLFNIVGTQQFVFGLDNSAENKLVLSSGTELGTNNIFVINSDARQVNFTGGGLSIGSLLGAVRGIGTGDDVGSIIDLGRSDTTVFAGDLIGEVRFVGGESIVSEAVSLVVTADIDWTSANNHGRFSIWINDGGITDVERFRIDSVGRVGIGIPSMTNMDESDLAVEGGSLHLKEKATSATDTADYGQTWVKNTTPNELWFTDDNGGDHYISIDSQATNSLVSIGGTISLLEQAAADDDTVNYGQVWVKNTSPNELWFTDDNGSDFILGGILGADITGSGTANKLSVFSGPQTISDSIIAQVTGDIGVNTVVPVSGFDIRNAVVTLSTSDNDIIATDILGQIDFRAPDEASGTDALLAGASIWAEADATFSAAVNNTDLVFATGESETAVEKMRLTSIGALGLGITPPANVDTGDMVLEGGAIVLKERATPTADMNYAKIYSKTDNELYFQDGAGSETQISNTVVSSHSDTNATGTELTTLTDGSDASTLHVHTIVSLDTTATGLELTELTDSSETILHSHALAAHNIASHSDTTATGAELETLTNASDASALHVHTILSLDTTATGLELTELTNASETTLHSHAAGSIGGSGTVGTIPIFVTDTTTIGNSNITVSSGNVTITKADTNILTIEDSSANGMAQLYLKNDVQTYAWQLFSNDQLFLSDITSGKFPMKITPGADSAQLVFAVGELIVNSDGTDIDFRVESGISTHGLFLRASDGNVGIGGVTVPTAKLHVLSTVGTVEAGLFIRDQLTSSAAVLSVIQDHSGSGSPAVEIQQDDISEGVINFVASDRGVISAGNSVASIRVEINGTVYVIPMYADQ